MTITVKAAATGVLRHPQIYVVRALEESIWNVDGTPVEVGPGLVIGLADESAASFLLQTDRAGEVAVAIGEKVVVLQDALALFFVESGLATLPTAEDYAAGESHYADGPSEREIIDALTGDYGTDDPDAGQPLEIKVEGEGDGEREDVRGRRGPKAGRPKPAGRGRTRRAA